MKKIIFILALIWTMFCLAITAKADDKLVVVIREPVEKLYEKLGYCKIPAPKGHGVYYVIENGKCVARVK